jgi:hypothetical protein
VQKFARRGFPKEKVGFSIFIINNLPKEANFLVRSPLLCRSCRTLGSAENFKQFLINNKHYRGGHSQEVLQFFDFRLFHKQDKNFLHGRFFVLPYFL